MNTAQKPAKQPMSWRKVLVLVFINIANLSCHAVYSILAAFFPQEAKHKGMSEDAVGVLFAIFAFIIFLISPFAGNWLSRYGKREVYLAGLAMVSVGTICFGFASSMSKGWSFFAWCFLMRILQGIGSGMEETAAYAIITELDADNVSFFLGITELSTGLGYMVGPPVGGFLFAVGGFGTPFFTMGSMIIPALGLIWYFVPSTKLKEEEGKEDEEEISLRALVSRGQVLAVAIAAMLANSDYAFLEPTLAEHVQDIVTGGTGAIGALFSVASVTYAVSCPLIGYLSNRERLGPRMVIIIGLALQFIGFVLIGPSPLVPGMKLSTSLVVVALVLFGLGESMSMTPIMDDMLITTADLGGSVVNKLSSVMASSFSLGQMIGPLLGSFFSARMGFAWACTLMAAVLVVEMAYLVSLHKGSAKGGYTALPKSPSGLELEHKTEMAEMGQGGFK